MPEPSSENQPEEVDLFLGEEATSLEGLPAANENLEGNEDTLIIKKSKKNRCR